MSYDKDELNTLLIMVQFVFYILVLVMLFTINSKIYDVKELIIRDSIIQQMLEKNNIKIDK